jgi:hypothetical protein
MIDMSRITFALLWFATSALAQAEDVVLSLFQNGADGVQFAGGMEHENIGASASGVGDVNGDGIDDLLIGAVGITDENSHKTGGAYLVYGTDAPLLGVLNTAHLTSWATTAIKIHGGETGALCGQAVAGIGYFNDDEFSDFAIGCPGARSATGITFVLFGSGAISTSFTLQGDSMVDFQGFRVTGATSGESAGSILAGGGDINGDSLDDLLIGAPLYHNTGAVYAVFGRSSGFQDIVMGQHSSSQAVAITVSGTNTYAILGSAMAIANVDGDLYADVVIGAQGTVVDNVSSAGRVYVLSGTNFLNGDISLDAFESNDHASLPLSYTISGIHDQETLGSGISDLGDLNGDGASELLIAASGTAYVVYSGANYIDLTSGDLRDQGGYGFRITGPGTTDQPALMQKVANVGDQNGDQVNDFALQILTRSNSANDYLVYVVYGRADGTDVDLRVRDTRLFMVNVATQDGVVYLNGTPCGREEIELFPKDHLSFLGIKSYYNYVVSTREETTIMTARLPSAPVVVDLLDFDEGLSSPQPIPLQQNPPLPVRTQSVGQDKNSNSLNNSVEFVSVPVRTSSQTKKESQGDSVPPPLPAAAVLASPTTLARQSEVVLKGVVKKLLRQYECSICMETLAGAVSLSPCGCCFCYVCVADWVDGHNAKKGKAATSESQYTAQCPHCNAEFSLLNALPNRVLDNAAREILLNLPEDLKEWEKRAEASNERRRKLQEMRTATTALTSSAKATSSVQRSVAAGAALSTYSHSRIVPGTTTGHPPAVTTVSRTNRVWESLAKGPPRAFEYIDLQDLQHPVAYPMPTISAGSHIGSPAGFKRGAAGAAAASKRARLATSPGSGAVPTFDLTSQPAYPVPAARASAASSSSSSSAARGATPAYYCVMSVPSLRSQACSICARPLAGSKVAVGVLHHTHVALHPNADNAAIANKTADSTHWLRECRTWYHLTCAASIWGAHSAFVEHFQLLNCLTQQEVATVRGTFGR